MKDNDSLKLLNHIAQILFDKKGFNILGLDVREVSTLTDYFVIAEGNVDKHVTALAKEVMELLKKKDGMTPIHVEGLGSGDWVVIDYMNIVVHLFMPGIRERYQLEKLWHEGEVVDLEIEVING
ncbi:MAG: Ribosomal silencing factor RsfS [Chlamydiales bacterium]|nr:Ribosomal silencing factor RsfS [Chlamydiales bacterium]MCH9619879.1 Ribosomal silencing factor RsfS [Chlamydiales bacterium]MCH9622694.1 Ribosomal silencing factor RsfS [Chlamydiales bacterium]